MSLNFKTLLTAQGSAAAGTAVDIDNSPFFESGEMVGMVSLNGFHGTLEIQGPDGAGGWTALATVTIGAPTSGVRLVTVDDPGAQVRAEVTAYTAGTVDAYLLAS